MLPIPQNKGSHVTGTREKSPIRADAISSHKLRHVKPPNITNADPAEQAYVR